MKTLHNETVLVTGATGKTGSRVMSTLLSLGVPVRPGSRSAAIPFDWQQPETWNDVLDGVRKVYICFQPDLAVPGALEIITAFSKLAVEKGIKHIVLLSGRGETDAEASEQVIMFAGASWTIVRASWFFQNFNESMFLEPVRAGVLALPATDIPEPFVDVNDIADVVVAALTETGHTEKIYEVTGPRLITFSQAASEIGHELNRNIAVHKLSVDEYKAMLEEHQVPAEYIALLEYLFTTVLDGRNASLATGVHEALGRQPKDFGEYVRETAKTGVWKASEN